MKPKLLLLLLALFSACHTAPNSHHVWLPKVGERVATNYSLDAPEHVGKVQIITVSRVDKARGLVYSFEFPMGVPICYVTKWK